jgi:hypothetical protein
MLLLLMLLLHGASCSRQQLLQLADLFVANLTLGPQVVQQGRVAQ